MTGSPKRFTATRNKLAIPCSGTLKTFPVKNKAQDEALINFDGLSPKCLRHCEGAILSSIKASMVVPSGTRRSASAKHIKATPSSDDRPYSIKNNSMTDGWALFRNWVTISVACLAILVRSVWQDASGSRSFNASSSLMKLAARILALRFCIVHPL